MLCQNQSKYALLGFSYSNVNNLNNMETLIKDKGEFDGLIFANRGLPSDVYSNSSTESFAGRIFLEWDRFAKMHDMDTLSKLRQDRDK